MAAPIPQSNTVAPGRRRRSWLLAGGVCLAACGLFVVFYSWMLLAGLTESKPRHIPLEPLPQHEADALEDRVLAFQQALRQQAPTPPLSLTTREMNGLIALHPGLKAARGRIRVNLDGEVPKAIVSARLSDLHFPVFRNRYFNGTIGFTLGMSEGRLVLRAREISSQRRSAPGLVMAMLRRYNLAAPINEDARFAVTLENIQNVEVDRGRIVITAKHGSR